MRRLFAAALLVLAACGGAGSPDRAPDRAPDLAPARAAALARAEATAERAREACRARGEQVIDLGPREWACGERGRAVAERQATRWRERCAESGTEAFRSGAASWFCALATADAGRECRAATDCQGVCVLPSAEARSGVCSATTVVPGCTARIGPDGQRRTVCAP